MTSNRLPRTIRNLFKVSIWSYPPGTSRFALGVIFSVCLVVAGAIFIYFVIKYPGLDLQYIKGALTGQPTLEFPPECTEHMGNWATYPNSKRQSIIWHGSKEDHFECVSAMNRTAYEAIKAWDPWTHIGDYRVPAHFDLPPSAAILRLDECAPFFDPTPELDEFDLEWVYHFAGTYENFQACNVALYGHPRVDSDVRRYRFRYLGRNLSYPFRMIGVPKNGG